MQVQVVGLSGGMGVGKDTVAEGLMKLTPCKQISFAQPLYDIARIVNEAKLGAKPALHELYALLLDVFGGPQNAPSFMDVAILMNQIMTAAGEQGLMEDTLHKRKPRRFLQFVGTEIVRAVDENAWAEYLNVRIMRDASKQVADYRSDLDSLTATLTGKDDSKAAALFKIADPVLTYVVTDLRFPNEVESLRKLPQMVDAKMGLPCKVFCIKLVCDLDVAVNRVAARDGLDPEQVKLTLGHASENGIDDDEFDFVIDASRSKSDVIGDVASIVSGSVVRVEGGEEAAGGPTYLSGPGFGEVINLDSLRQ